jgi:hypothetical protein
VLLILHVLLYKYELLYKFANMHCNKLENGYKIVFSTATAGEPTLPTAGAQSTKHAPVLASLLPAQQQVRRWNMVVAGESGPVRRQ